MIKLKNITKKFNVTTPKIIFKNANLEIKNNGLYCIRGVSGSGKSTLLNIISGVEKTKGEIIIEGEKIKTKLDFLRLRKNKIGYLSQTYSYDEEITVEQYYNLLSQLLNEKVYYLDLFKYFDREYILKKRYETLSAGEKKVVEIIGTLMLKNKNMILLDEPFSNLEANLIEKTSILLKDLSKDKIVVFSSHQSDVSTKISDYFIDIIDAKLYLKVNESNDFQYTNYNYFKIDNKKFKEPIYKLPKKRKRNNLLFLVYAIFTLLLLLFLSFKYVNSSPTNFLNNEYLVNIDSYYFENSYSNPNHYEKINKLTDEKGDVIVLSRIDFFAMGNQHHSFNFDLERVRTINKNDDIKLLHGYLVDKDNIIYIDNSIFNKYRYEFSLMGVNSPQELIGLEIASLYNKDDPYIIGGVTDTGSHVLFQNEKGFLNDSYLRLNYNKDKSLYIGNVNKDNITVQKSEVIISTDYSEMNSLNIGDTFKLELSETLIYDFDIVDIKDLNNGVDMILENSVFTHLYKLNPINNNDNYYFYLKSDNIDILKNSLGNNYSIFSKDDYLNYVNYSEIKTINNIKVIILIGVIIFALIISAKFVLTYFKASKKIKLFYIYGIGIVNTILDNLNKYKNSYKYIFFEAFLGIWLFLIISNSELKTNFEFVNLIIGIITIYIAITLIYLVSSLFSILVLRKK